MARTDSFSVDFAGPACGSQGRSEPLRSICAVLSRAPGSPEPAIPVIPLMDDVLAAVFAQLELSGRVDSAGVQVCCRRAACVRPLELQCVLALSLPCVAVGVVCGCRCRVIVAVLLSMHSVSMYWQRVSFQRVSLQRALERVLSRSGDGRPATSAGPRLYRPTSWGTQFNLPTQPRMPAYSFGRLERSASPEVRWRAARASGLVTPRCARAEQRGTGISTPPKIGPGAYDVSRAADRVRTAAPRVRQCARCCPKRHAAAAYTLLR